MSRTVRALALVALYLGLPGLSRADDEKSPPPDGATPKEVSYYRDVKPLLVKHCQGCHQPARARGKLVLTDYVSLLSGGRSQEDDPILVPGKPEESLLYLEIVPEEEGKKPSMPKDAPALAPADTALVRNWILQGAKDDTPDSAKTLAISPEKPPVYTQPPVLTALDYSPDGSLLAVSGYHEVLLHKADGSGLVARLVGQSERIEDIAFSPDGKRLAVTGGQPARLGEVQIWDVAEKKLLVSAVFTSDTLYGASWSPDGKLLAFGCGDNTLRAIDTETGQQVLFQGAHSDWVLDAVFSKDGSHLVSIGRDRTMKLVVVKTEQFVDNITSITPGALKGGLIAIDRHPTEDQLLVGGADGAPKIYRMFRKQARKIGDDYNLIRKFDRLPGRVYSTEFNHDGTKIVACSSLDGRGEVRVYETKEGKLLWKLETDEALYAVTFSPDGKTVACAGFGGQVNLIDGEKGTPTKRFLPVPLATRRASF